MARLALLFSLVLSVLALAATTAGAATHIGAGLESDWPPVFQPYMRGIGVLADNGVNHDIVINPSHAQQAGGFPQAVDVYDYGDTVVVDHGPCRVYSAHHAACIVSGPPHDPNDSYSYD